MAGTSNNPPSHSMPGLSSPLGRLDPKENGQILEYITQQVLLLKEKALLQSSVREEKKLLVENAKLKKDIADLKTQLTDSHRRRTAKALFAPAAPPTPAPSPSPSLPPHPHRDREVRRRRGDRKGRGGRQEAVCVLGAEPREDVSRLDLRIGRIVAARRHPLAEALYVQEVDLGEESVRTVVSTLGPHTPLDQLQGSLCVCVCNVRACRLRGVVSQAMLLCGSAPDHLELLAPPPGATPGDRITFHNYPGEPEREAGRGVWERVQAELAVDGRGVACYRGAGLEVRGKGLCRAPTLTNSSIK